MHPTANHSNFDLQRGNTLIKVGTYKINNMTETNAYFYCNESLYLDHMIGLDNSSLSGTYSAKCMHAV